VPGPAAPQDLFPGGDRPAPESRSRRGAIQFVACAALLASSAYVAWRIAFTLGDLWLAIPLLLLEIHAVAGLGLFAFSLWNVDGQAAARIVDAAPMRVGVLIPTYNEPRAVLFPTVAAAVSLEPRHRTVVLDDGRRPWVAEMAASLGAEYMTRPERTHAKAGNLNHALEALDLDVVAVLDADHIAKAGLLTHTLGYFDDPSVALVQTPQDFYNLDSFEHARNRSWLPWHHRSVPFNEQQLFYRALQPGKNRWNAAFWCGTSAVARVSAIRDVGGIAFESVTEDMHTTIRLHRRGWRTVYHNEVLARGLAARDGTEYQAQRIRWGTGAMQILRQERPITGRGLTFRQRLAYASTLLGWFDAWRTLGYVLLPPAVLFTGASPVVAPWRTFAIVFGVVFLLQRAALAVLSRGYAPQGMATLFEFVRLQSNIRATLVYFRRGERAFQVTAKQGSDRRRRVDAPRLHYALIALTACALVWMGCTLAGLTPVSYRVAWAAYGAAFWALVNAGFLLAALIRIRSDRFAADRRDAARLQLDVPARLGDRAAYVVDISLGGALVACDRPPEPVGAVSMGLLWGDRRISLRCNERGRDILPDGSALIRLQFADGQATALAELTRCLFGTGEHRGRQYEGVAALAA
jgi:cellulose synthase/poly-beta-1,6-N-acetylglucosamine synthase-like glycosyltransferase